jgi:hypothetical protein
LKMVLFLPTRSDQYRTGPLEVSFINTETKKNGIINNNTARIVRIKSNSLFIKHNCPTNWMKSTYTSH